MSHNEHIMASTELGTTEKARLSELESVIDRGKQTFFQVGSALLEIRESKLYRATHGTFSAYCLKRHGFSDSRGRQLIAAAKTVTAVTDKGLPKPATEREARELARQLRAEANRLDPDEGRQQFIASVRDLLEKGDRQLGEALGYVELALNESSSQQELVEVDELMTDEVWDFLHGSERLAMRDRIRGDVRERLAR